MRFIGNRPAQNHYSPLSRIINHLIINTILLIRPVSVKIEFYVRRAKDEDIPVIVNFLNKEHSERLFGNVYSEETFPKQLERNRGLLITDYFLAFDKTGKCCGVCAAWDMGSMKQTRVLHYGKAFQTAKIAYKTVSVLFNRPPLPKPGAHFREVTITDYAVRDRDPGIMNALLRAVYREYRQLGYHFIIWGSSIDDPLLKAAQGFMRQRVVSNIVLFSTKNKWLEEGMVKNHLPYIDVSAI
jgi:hypothetical protein